MCLAMSELRVLKRIDEGSHRHRQAREHNGSPIVIRIEKGDVPLEVRGSVPDRRRYRAYPRPPTRLC